MSAQYWNNKNKGICTYCRHHQAMPHRELCFPCFKKYSSLKRSRRQQQQRKWFDWIFVVMLWHAHWQEGMHEAQSA